MNDWDWKGPLGFIWSNPPAQAGPPRTDCPGYIQMFFECLQGGRLQNLPWQPVPMLSHHHSKKVLPDVQMGPPVFQVLLISSGHLASSIPVKTPWLHPLHSFCLGICTHCWNPTLILLFSRLNSPSSRSFLAGDMLQPPPHLDHPLLGPLWHHKTKENLKLDGIIKSKSLQLHLSLVLGTPELDAVLQARPWQWMGRIHPPRPGGSAPNAAQDTVSHLSRRSTLLVSVKLAIRWELWVTFCQVPWQLSGPQHLPGLVLSQMQELVLFLVEFPKVLVIPFLQPVRVPLYESVLPVLYHQQTLRGYSSLLSPSSFGKVFNRIRHSIVPWVILLGSGL